MPGPPSEFTDKTVVFIYGAGGIGKSTFSNFLHKTLPSIFLSMDSVCYNVYRNNIKLIEKFILINTPITHQIGRLNTMCANNPIIVNSIVTGVINNIETHFIANPDIQLMIIEGHGLDAMSDVLQRSIAYCVKNNIRYWCCHK